MNHRLFELVILSNEKPDGCLVNLMKFSLLSIKKIIKPEQVVRICRRTESEGSGRTISSAYST